MDGIRLTAEQSRLLDTSVGYVSVRDATGQVVGYLLAHRFTPKQIAEAERRVDSEGPWYKTEQVLAHLCSLESP